MEKQMIKLAKFMVLTALIAVPCLITKVRAQTPETGSDTAWAATTAHGDGEESKTVMQFYLHELAAGPNATAIEVVRSPGSNQTFSGFGYLAMIDDVLRDGSDPNSRLVGRAQGIDGSSSQAGTELITAFTYTFSEGIYNQSSFSVLGMNSILKPVRELPVVGGTGVFRMARGYALIHTVALDPTTGIVVVGYNVTLFHY